MDRSYTSAVLVDSPIATAVAQVLPFYRAGTFCAAQSPLFLRRQWGQYLSPLRARVAQDCGLQVIARGQALTLPLRRGGVAYYPFNSQGNLNAVNNRQYRHVLILHGESNKAASVRPAARIYDFVCIAGPLARARYREAGIFTDADLRGGRLIEVGDLFVQDLYGYRPGQAGDYLLYTPTWEGYGSRRNDHSSLIGGFGRAVVKQIMSGGAHHGVIIRPHPYTGTLSRAHLIALRRDVMALARDFPTFIDLRDANPLLRLAMAGLRHFNAQDAAPISLALCDVSGMEAALLKARIPHRILLRQFSPPAALAQVYRVKSIAATGAPAPDHAALQEADAAHRALVFGHADPAMAAQPPAIRRAFVEEMIMHSRFWEGGRDD
ncbi:hypothetical protein [Ketogulonicigenium vulgare]|uniref:hypothetical protein n=1 Tax=Ketogulonicigenium vulgare TaxID=92945 RepID=UPI0023581A81|nr:hypothetical protein [Ketogulonicigenium vulgare]